MQGRGLLQRLLRVHEMLAPVLQTGQGAHIPSYEQGVRGFHAPSNEQRDNITCNIPIEEGKCSVLTHTEVQ